MARGGPGVRHPDLAARPSANLLDRIARPRVVRLNGLEQVQHMLRAHGRPQSQQPVIGVREGAAASDGDEAPVADLGEDHVLFLAGIAPRNAYEDRYFGFEIRVFFTLWRGLVEKYFGAMSENYRLYAQKIAEQRASRRTAAHPLRRELEDLLRAVEWCEKVWAIEDRIEKSR